MEIREYDSSYDLLNQHLTTKKCVYGIKRYPAIFLKNKDLMILKLKDAVWKFSDDFFKEHNCFFSEHKPIQNHYNNTNPYAINVNYQPFGTTYYHVITEVLPNALFLSEIIDNKEMPILVPESKFISNIFAWFDIKNPITFKLDGPYNFLKQQTTECGFPSPQKIFLLREIINRKVEYKKEIGIYIYRKENWRQIKNSDKIFNFIKKRFNTIEWVLFNDQNLMDTIDIFSRAKIIIGPHGAGLTNMIFAPTNISIIEIMPIQEPNMCYWHQSCILENKHYIYPENYISSQDRNFDINIDEFKKALISITF